MKFVSPQRLRTSNPECYLLVSMNKRKPTALALCILIKDISQ